MPCIFQAAGHQLFRALQAQHRARLPGQWQREITQAAEQVQHAVLRLQRQKLQRLLNHQLIHAPINLHEIQRLKAKLKVESG